MKALRDLAIATLAFTLAAQAILLPRLLLPNINGRLDRLEAGYHGTNLRLQKLINGARFGLDQNLRALDRQQALTLQLERGALALLPQAAGTLSDFRATIQGVNGLVGSVQKDLDSITSSTNADLGQLKTTLVDLSTLLATINRDGAAAGDTVTQLTADLETIDKILSNPKLAETIAHVDAATGSAARSVETIQIVLEPLRKKARLALVILRSLLGIFKITVPLPF